MHHSPWQRCLSLGLAIAGVIVASRCYAVETNRLPRPMQETSVATETAVEGARVQRDLMKPPRRSPLSILRPRLSLVTFPKSQEDPDDLLSPSVVLPAPKRSNEISNETSDESTDIETRLVTPYPTPNFRTPAEKVVPLPVVPAPEDFPGFWPSTTNDANLPEPRRIFLLPKPPERPPSFEQKDAPEYRPGGSAQAFNYLEPLDANSGRFADPERFPSLLSQSIAIHSASGPNGFSAAPIESHHAWLRLREETSHRARLDPHQWRLSARSSMDTTTVCAVPYQATDFQPTPYEPQPLDPYRELETYYGKTPIDTQRPWVEWWRPFYTGGMYSPAIPVMSNVNPLTPSFLVYGDYRTGVGVHRNNGAPVRSWANRLNLDMDMRFTSTERFHLFTGPLDHNGKFTRLDFSDGNVKFVEELDAQVDTAFFEGDLGAMTGGVLGMDAPFDLPFTCGLVPLLYQNGIWMEDAIAGVAFGSPWRHSRGLKWSNFDATFFAGFNQVTSPAFQNDNNAASVYGTAWFIEAYQGYIEADYAYLDDLDAQGRSYHNAAIAYTRRYFGRISNSVRLIGNAGQQGARVDRSADGGLLLVENCWISALPSTVVPYSNFFVGYGRPQSVARAVGAGGILRNTGINFETDGLTGFPTLDATGANSYGVATGVNLLAADFRQQLVLEFAALDTYGDPRLSSAKGAQYAIGTRWQRALSNRSIWRIDLMNGWFDNAPDIYGTRTEFRWKF